MKLKNMLNMVPKTFMLMWRRCWCHSTNSYVGLQTVGISTCPRSLLTAAAQRRRGDHHICLGTMIRARGERWPSVARRTTDHAHAASVSYNDVRLVQPPPMASRVVWAPPLRSELLRYVPVHVMISGKDFRTVLDVLAGRFR